MIINTNSNDFLFDKITFGNLFFSMGIFLKRYGKNSIFSKKSIPKQLMVVKKYKKNTFPQLKQMTWSVKNSRIVKVRSFQAFIKVMTTTVFSNGSKHFMTLPLVGTNDQGLSKISQPKCNKSLEKYKQAVYYLFIIFNIRN